MRKYVKQQELVSVLFLIIVAILFLPGLSCDTEVKKLGKDTGKINPNEPAREKFLLFTGIFSLESPREVLAYGKTGTRQEFLRQCGFQGRACVCELFDNPDGNAPILSEGDDLEYDERINMFRCTLPDGVGINTISYMRIRNRAKTSITNIVLIKTTNPEEKEEEKRLQLEDLLVGVSLLEIIKVYEYGCFINYLEKEDISSDSFSCSDGVLAVLQVQNHYYLFSTNKVTDSSESFNNFDERIPDVLYNDGTGSLCTESLRRIDCTSLNDGESDPNAISLQFGILSRPVAHFTEPMSFVSAPGDVGGRRKEYGFAAAMDSKGRCPPGFEAIQEFRAFPEEIRDSNLDNGNPEDGAGGFQNTILLDRVFLAPGETKQLHVERFGGGFCMGANQICFAPSIDRDKGVLSQSVQAQDYVSFGESFCVIPKHLLENL